MELAAKAAALGVCAALMALLLKKSNAELALCLGLLPVTALAAEGDSTVYMGSVELTSTGGASVYATTDESGAVTGHVINSLSNNSYGGAVKISVGFDADGAITGVGIREINDTPGLGLKAKEAGFRDQYVGKNADSLTVTKTGASEDNEIDAISGATVTSNAVTNAVNAALYYLHNCMN